MPDDSNSGSGFKCCRQNKLDRPERVCREVHDLVYSGRGIEFDISICQATISEEYLLVLAVKLDNINWIQHIGDPTHQFNHHLFLEIDVVDITLRCSENTLYVQIIHYYGSN